MREKNKSDSISTTGYFETPQALDNELLKGTQIYTADFSEIS